VHNAGKVAFLLAKERKKKNHRYYFLPTAIAKFSGDHMNVTTQRWMKYGYSLVPWSFRHPSFIVTAAGMRSITREIHQVTC